jgi:hypothetical protein
MMGQMKATLTDDDGLKIETPQLLGEIFDDGSFRGHTKNPEVYRPIKIGDYGIWDAEDGGDNMIGVVHFPTGQMGLFKKEHFESYVSSFFGLLF